MNYRTVIQWGESLIVADQEFAKLYQWGREHYELQGRLINVDDLVCLIGCKDEHGVYRHDARESLATSIAFVLGFMDAARAPDA